MTENDNNVGIKQEINENDMRNMQLNKFSDENQLRSQTIRAGDMKNIKVLQNYSRIKESEIDKYIPFHKIKRCNSVDLYKRKMREKKLKDKDKINDLNENEKFDEINNLNSNSNNINEKKIKRVTFLKPNFVIIVDVESYKQFNQVYIPINQFEEISDSNNDKSNDNISSDSKNDNPEKNKGTKDNEKEVVCSCLIF